MDRGAWRATVHMGLKESDMTKHEHNFTQRIYIKIQKPGTKFRILTSGNSLAVQLLGLSAFTAGVQE